MNSRVIYSRTSLSRLPDYQVTTNILKKADGTLVVRKFPANPRAQAFVRSLPNKYQNLSCYALPFEVVPTVRYWNEVESPYIVGETLQTRWHSALRQRNRARLVEVCEHFRELVHALPVVDPPPPELFQGSFGVDPYAKDHFVEPGLLDLGFDNLIITPTGQLYLVDYEWTVPFSVSREFILFRALTGWFASVVNYAPWRIITLAELLDIATVPRSEVLRLDYMERYFQGSIHGGSSATPDLNRLLNGDPLVGIANLEQFSTQNSVASIRERLAHIEQTTAEKQLVIDHLQQLCDERGKLIEHLEATLRSLAGGNDSNSETFTDQRKTDNHQATRN